MNRVKVLKYEVAGVLLPSLHLKRDVLIDFYVPESVEDVSELSLLLINDGQDMPVMQYDSILNSLYSSNEIKPVLCAAITAGPARKSEYGVAATPDYQGRGEQAEQYTQFILKELLPFITKKFGINSFKETAFAGFSLGGLSALDIVWNHPEVFSRVGVFSGSLWWRSKDQNDTTYDDDKDRIMQQQIRNGKYNPGLKFFLQCGLMDEAYDRNKNGIIDAVDDTRDIVNELLKKGYKPEDLSYLELDDGRHDVPTWGRAMPVFLKWGWGKQNL